MGSPTSMQTSCAARCRLPFFKHAYVEGCIQYTNDRKKIESTAISNRSNRTCNTNVHTLNIDRIESMQCIDFSNIEYIDRVHPCYCCLKPGHVSQRDHAAGVMALDRRPRPGHAGLRRGMVSTGYHRQN